MKVRIERLRKIVREELESRRACDSIRRIIGEELSRPNAIEIVGDAIDRIYGVGDDYDALRDAGNELDLLYSNDEVVHRVLDNLAKISAVRRWEGEASPKENQYVNAAMKAAAELMR